MKDSRQQAFKTAEREYKAMLARASYPGIPECEKAYNQPILARLKAVLDSFNKPRYDRSRHEGSD